MHDCAIGLIQSNHMGHFMNYFGLKYYTEHSGTVFTMKDYLDRRRATNFTQFDYCPFCGKKIDWKKMRKEIKEG